MNNFSSALTLADAFTAAKRATTPAYIVAENLNLLGLADDGSVVRLPRELFNNLSFKDQGRIKAGKGDNGKYYAALKGAALRRAWTVWKATTGLDFYTESCHKPEPIRGW